MTYDKLPHGTLLVGDKNIWFVYIDDNGRKWEIKLLGYRGEQYARSSTSRLESDSEVGQKIVFLNDILERIMNGKT